MNHKTGDRVSHISDPKRIGEVVSVDPVESVVAICFDGGRIQTFPTKDVVDSVSGLKFHIEMKIRSLKSLKNRLADEQKLLATRKPTCPTSSIPTS